MFRFKAGIVVGFGLGWLVASGKAAELIEQFRQKRKGGAPAVGGDKADGVYDFAVRAAQ